MSFSNEDIAFMQMQAREDPCWFASRVLRRPQWGVQDRIMRSVWRERVTYVPACHASGKSFLAGNAAVTFLVGFEGSRVVTTAPGERQVKGVLWSEIHTGVGGAVFPLSEVRPLQLEWKLRADWFAIGYVASKNFPDSFSGFHAKHVLVILDEANGIDKRIWEAVEGLVSSGDAHLLAIGNPLSGSSEFSRRCKKLGANVINISAFDTPNFEGIVRLADGKLDYTNWKNVQIQGLVEPQWAERMAEEYGVSSAFYIARVLGQFPINTINELIPEEYRRAAMKLTLPQGKPVILGVDVAREGDDRTVFRLRRGGWSRVVGTTSKEDLIKTSDRVLEFIDKYPDIEQVNIDDIGLGGGVTDMLRRHKSTGRMKQAVGAVNFSATQTAIKTWNQGVDKESRVAEKFVNGRAEIYWLLRLMMYNKQLDIEDDEELCEELGVTFENRDRDDAIQLEAKRDLKSRIGRSPDKADSLAIAYAPVFDTIIAKTDARTTQTLDEVLFHLGGGMWNESGNGGPWL